MTQNERWQKATELYEEGYRTQQEEWQSIRARLADKVPGAVERIERLQTSEYGLNKKADVAAQEGQTWLARCYLIGALMIRANLDVQMRKIQVALDDYE